MCKAGANSCTGQGIRRWLHVYAFSTSCALQDAATAPDEDVLRLEQAVGAHVRASPQTDRLAA